MTGQGFPSPSELWADVMSVSSPPPRPRPAARGQLPSPARFLVQTPGVLVMGA